MTQEQVLEYNKICAEFLGACIFEDTGKWYVVNWSNPKHYPNMITSSCNVEMWGTKEETYEKILLEQVNPSYGRWGQFHSDWNWIMEVARAINKTLNPKRDGDTTHSTLKREVQALLGKTDKEAVVQAINKFLIWYKNETKTN